MQMDKEFFNAIVGKIAWLKHKRKKKDTKEVNQNTKPKYSKGKKCFTGKKKKRKKNPIKLKRKILVNMVVFPHFLDTHTIE